MILKENENMKLQLLWIVLAILCVLYGFMVLGTGSGTGFFLVWFVMAAGFLFLACAAKNHLWTKIPSPIKGVFLLLLFVCLTLFLFVETSIISRFHKAQEQDLDYLIVLGAQVYETGPSVVLRYRLDAAADYLKDNRDTLCIVTGGQGYNEPFTEAEGMRDYIVAEGIAEERILVEAKAKNTKENMVYSMELFDPEKDTVGIVTNNFHVYRSLRLAKKSGIVNAYPVSADSTALYLPNNLLREFLGVIKDFLIGNI